MTGSEQRTNTHAATAYSDVVVFASSGEAVGLAGPPIFVALAIGWTRFLECRDRLEVAGRYGLRVMPSDLQSAKAHGCCCRGREIDAAVVVCVATAKRDGCQRGVITMKAGLVVVYDSRRSQGR